VPNDSVKYPLRFAKRSVKSNGKSLLATLALCMGFLSQFATWLLELVAVQTDIFFSRRHLWRITECSASLCRVQVEDSFATLVCLYALEEINLKMSLAYLLISSREKPGKDSAKLFKNGEV